jgi:hypothetical protein
MAKEKQEKTNVLTENREIVSLKLEKEYFTPALQTAVKKAVDANFEAKDIINGVTNAYLNMIVVMLGKKEAAANLLRAQADHLLNLEKGDT